MLTAVVAALPWHASPAQAHAALASSEPGAGYGVTTPVDEVVLHFSDPVALAREAVTVSAGDGRRVPVRVALRNGGSSVEAIPEKPLQAGRYQVRYRVVALDGDLIEGSYPFGVATPVASASTAGSPQPDADQVRAETAAWRWLLFAGLAVALGGLYTAWRVHGATGGYPGRQPLIRAGALAATAGAVGQMLELVGLPGLPSAMTDGGPAALLAAQAALLVAAAAAGPALRGGIAGVLLLAVVALEAVRAHPGEVAPAGGPLLTAAHLLAAALWVGGLVHVLRLASGWRDNRRAVRVAVSTYARSAWVLVVIVSATGTAAALLLLPSVDAWTGTTYGQMLLAKIVLFIGVLAAALAARRRLRRPAAGGDVPPRPLIGKAVRVELALLSAVVLATAALTTATPTTLVPASALLATPVGPVLRVAERQGEVTVAVVAFDGRIEVRAAVPGEDSDISLSGRLAQPDGTSHELDLVSCGMACWTAPAPWTEGTSTAIFDVVAGEWSANDLRIDVPWPVTPAPELPAKVQAAMGAQTAIDTTEHVTSGFGRSFTHRSRRTGQEFLEDQPWSGGGATDPTVVPSGAHRTLHFALPGLGYHFALTLDERDRILSERTVTANHVLVRTYRYPG